MDFDEEYQNTIKKFARLDKIARIKKIFLICLFSALLSALVFYAFRIERKISDLSQLQSVIVYKNVISEEVPSTSENEVIERHSHGSDKFYTDSVSTYEDTIENISEDDTAEQQSDADITVQQTEAAQNKEQVYYVTKTGKKYHTADCSYLKSKIEITYDDIISKGYSPCSRCIGK